MLTGYPVRGKKKSVDIVEAFIAGAPKDAIGNVFFGIDESNVAQWRAAKQSDWPFFYGDNSYFDAARGKQFRFTNNRLQHDGRGTSNGKRFHALRLVVEPEEPYREDGYVLVLPQSEQFMRLTLDYRPRRGCNSWLDEQTFPGMKTKVRPWSPNKAELQHTLREDLLGARVVHTYSSAGAITAVLAGVRVSCSSDCAAHRYSGMKVGSMEDRFAWAAVLADNQHSLEEMRAGMAWEKVNA